MIFFPYLCIANPSLVKRRSDICYMEVMSLKLCETFGKACAVLIKKEGKPIMSSIKAAVALALYGSAGSNIG